MMERKTEKKQMESKPKPEVGSPETKQPVQLSQEEAAIKAYLDQRMDKAEQMYPTKKADLHRFREAIRRQKSGNKH